MFDDYPNQLVEIYSVLAERIGETLSGESAPFSVSVFGADLDVDDKVAGEIAAVLEKVPDSGSVRLVVPPRQPELRVALKPEALALYGLQAGDVLDTINAAFHGSRVARSSRPIAACRSRCASPARAPIRMRSARCCCAAATARSCRSRKSPTSRRSPRAA